MSQFKICVTGLVTVLILVSVGCTSVERIPLQRWLLDWHETGPITVLTKDRLIYKFQSFKLTDSTLLGAPNVGLHDSLTVLPFPGIEYVETRSVSVLKSLVALGVSTFVARNAISYLQSDNPGVTVSKDIRTYYPSYSGGGGGGYGSCPFIYSFDGVSNVLESETFADALCEAAERASYDILYHLKPVNGDYRLTLTNERPETHFNNEIRLLVVDSPIGDKVIPDNTGAMHTISNAVLPISSNDFAGQDALREASQKDGILWRSNISTMQFSNESDLRDGLILEFPRPNNAHSAKLVVHGGNTKLSAFAFTQLGRLLGDDALQWYQSLKYDSSSREAALTFFKRAGTLHVFVWSTNQWVEQPALLDVGPAILKDQIAILDLHGIQGTTLKVKLESTTDLWRIDQVYVDFSPEHHVQVQECVIASATDQHGFDVRDKLARNDSLYYVSTPGDAVDIRFKELSKNDARERWYVVKSKGYYHEWRDATSSGNPALLAVMLRNPSLASRMYLELWRQEKSRWE